MAETAASPQAAFCFPNDPLLVRLLEAAKRVGGSEVIIEDFNGFRKTYLQLLADVLETRHQLKSLIPASNFDARGLLREENVYVTALTRTGYQYVVAFYAVRALGGAYTPLVGLTSEPLEEQGGAQVNYNESHWLGGAKNVIESIALGKKVFALECPAGASAVLDVFQRERITYFVFNPAILRGMRDILLGNEQLTEEKQEKFSAYFSGLKFFLCIGGLLDQPTVDFWEAVIGHPLQNRYGASELTGLVTTGLSKINGSVGKLSPGIQMKLSEGTHGRLSIKSPNMFLGYLGEPEKTRAALDEEGYYHTGDMVDLKDDELLLLGRERDDSCVVAVPLEQGKQLCGAVVRLKDGVEPEKITLDRVRGDLQADLDVTSLPTLLRLLGPQEDLPRTATGKPIKYQVMEDFFYAGDCGRDWFAVENPPHDVEFCGMPIAVPA
ncbi:hypothetical protein SLS63_006440 [Diaporthe eres]|uniref:AMP-dependent synthetase/ligase domain-containing protein n=1 Tax=Diaporthe eres TaxID=83184 RepID=A0ABR1P872_DIAER